jgi:SAM-dependent methyltransferase
MGNEFKGRAEHSAEYFGDTRDQWWNGDFIAMLARRWRLDQVQTVLDVGCGVGHWGRVLATALPAMARLVGVDAEPEWVARATERAAVAGLSDRFSYRAGRAETLPFGPDAFDVVTCQTLLMHVPAPAKVLAEMVRVARPGGLVLVAEPTNVAGLLLESVALGDGPETTAALLELQLICARGKKALGHGDDLIGEALPRLLAEVGLESIEFRQNDRVWPMTAPYRSAAEQAQVSEAIDLAGRERWIWDRETTRRYFLAGGGEQQTFAERWSGAMGQQRRVVAALQSGGHSCAGGSLFYVAWGRKPVAAT